MVADAALALRPGSTATSCKSLAPWSVHFLHEVLEFLDEKRRPIKSADRAKRKGKYPYYGASGIIDYVNDYLFDDDLILIGEDGENIISRNCRLVFKASGKFWVNNHAHVLKPRNGHCLEFFTEYLESLDYRKYNSSSAQPKLTKAALANIKLLVPTPKEQQRIATVLSETDALISSLEKLIEKKRNIKQGVMQELLTGKRRLPGFTGEWKEGQLGQHIEVDPENLSSSTSPNYSFRYISLEAVERGKLLEVQQLTFRQAPSRARRIVRKNDILIATVRPNLQSHYYVADEVKHLVCSTGFAVLRADERTLHAPFVFFNFFASFINDQINLLISGSNYPAINSRDVRSLRIRYPFIDEQIAISRVISVATKEIEELEQRRVKLQFLKRALMQTLLTGKIRLST